MEEYSGAGQIGVNDLLLARGVGGGAYGGFGGGFLGAGQGGVGIGGANAAYSAAANSIRIDEHAKAHDAGLENLLDQNQFNATNKNIVDGFNRATDTSVNNVNRVADNQFRSELRQSDNMSAMYREMSSNARVADKCCCDTQKAIADAAKDAAKCCCDAQLKAAENQAAVLAAIASQGAETITRELNAANARVIQLETINSLRV